MAAAAAAVTMTEEIVEVVPEKEEDQEIMIDVIVPRIDVIVPGTGKSAVSHLSSFSNLPHD